MAAAVVWNVDRCTAAVWPLPCALPALLVEQPTSLQQSGSEPPPPRPSLQATTTLSTYYIGLARNTSTFLYVWLDGSSIGNGAVSNMNPYAHW
jgi:hypothetical protein